MLQDGVVLTALKEPGPHVALLKQRNVRPVEQLPVLDRQGKHALHDGELAVDLGRRGPGRQPPVRVLPHVRRGDVCQAPPPKALCQMQLEATLQARKTAALVRLVFRLEVRRRFLEAQAADFRRDGHAPNNVPFPHLQQVNRGLLLRTVGALIEVPTVTAVLDPPGPAALIDAPISYRLSVAHWHRRHPQIWRRLSLRWRCVVMPYIPFLTLLASLGAWGRSELNQNIVEHGRTA